FAMTVHKSQGSEFERVGLLLPPALSPILTRELVYTGVTRAKKAVRLYGTPEVLQQAVERRVERASGLRDALWSV
ncbi:MAG: ATP-binding domain-containing protein, partial [Nannocystales bacterium]